MSDEKAALADMERSIEDTPSRESPKSSSRAASSPAFKLKMPSTLNIVLCTIAVFLWVGTAVRNLHKDRVKHLTVEERVDRILSSTPLIDGHNDLAIFIREAYHNHIYGSDFRSGFENGGLPMHVDLPRLRAGKSGGAFWSVFTPCPTNGTDMSDDDYAASVRDTLQQIDLMARLKAAYPNDFSPNLDSSTALDAFKKGQLISPLGIEGLHQIGNSVANLRRYYAMGVRYATLNHNCPNKYADAALWGHPLRKAPKVHGGLSKLGRQLVLEMNRLGMIVDLSHTSVDTMVDVLVGRHRKDQKGEGDEPAWNGSLAPVIFSHSSAYGLCPHPRNVPDHVLRMVQARRGLVMINFSPDFVSCHWTPESRASGSGIPAFYPPNSTLEHVVSHIVYIGSLIGYEHVGLGGDFDGIVSTPSKLDDVAAYPALVAALLRRNVTDEQAAKVVGGNILRVWREVDEVALKLQASGAPVLEDDLPELEL